MHSVELLSPFPLEECRALIQQQLRESPGEAPVAGRLTGARLRARKRIGYRNSFQTYLVADMAEHGGGTLIRCRFAMHPAVLAFIAIWFLAVLQIGGGGVFSAGMIAFGVLLVSGGIYLARGESAFLLDFVRVTLRARQVSGNGG
jgi:hypothetical protein